MNERINHEIEISETLKKRIEEVAEIYSDLLIDVYYDHEEEEEFLEEAVSVVISEVETLTRNLLFKKELERNERESKDEES